MIGLLYTQDQCQVQVLVGTCVDINSNFTDFFIYRHMPENTIFINIKP